MEAHQHPIDPIHPGSGRREGLLKRIGTALAAVGLVIAKLGAKAKLLLVALPKLKLLSTSASMLVSIVAYSADLRLALRDRLRAAPARCTRWDT